MSVPSSPAGGQPLQSISLNTTRDRLNFAESTSNRDSSVHDKITQFNTLAMQSKQLERKNADAALKRAVLGREEAEAEVRRYREEMKALRKTVDEGKDRERKVGERLEQVMVRQHRHILLGQTG
jgi:hypothetical protein